MLIKFVYFFKEKINKIIKLRVVAANCKSNNKNNNNI